MLDLWVYVYMVWCLSNLPLIQFDFSSFLLSLSAPHLNFLYLHYFFFLNVILWIPFFFAISVYRWSVGKLDLWSYKFKRSQSSLVKAAHWTPFFFAFFILLYFLFVAHLPSLFFIFPGLSRVFDLVVILFSSVIVSIAIGPYNSPICYGLALASKQWYNRNEKKNVQNKKN